MRQLSTSLLVFVSFLGISQTESDVVLISTTDFETVLKTASNPCDKAALYYENRKSNPDSTLYYLDLAHKLAKDCEEDALKAKIALRLGQNLNRVGDYQSVEPYYLEALMGFIAVSDTERVAFTHKCIGVNNKKMFRYVDALKAFNTSAYYYYLINDKEGIATLDLNIGLVHKNMNRYDEAKVKYHRALAGFTTLQEPELMADCYNNLGNVFRNEKKIDSAMYYMYKTLGSRLKYGPEHKLAYIYHNLANLHLEANQFDSSAWYLNQSIAIKSELDNDFDLSSDYFIYGNLYQKQGDYPRAIEAYEKAKKLVFNENEPGQGYDITLELAQAYYENKNYAKSAENFALYFKQRDTLALSNNVFEIQDELILYEFLKDSVETEKLLVEQELQELKYKNKQLSNDSIRKQLYLILGIVVLLVVMIGMLVYSFMKRLRQAREHRSILALQNDELKRTLVSKEEKETLLKEIHHRVKNNLQIISSLIRLQSGYINANNFQERLNEIESRILSMALVHEKLYQSNDLSKLVVKSYIRDLCINILESNQSQIKVKFVFDIDDSKFSIDTLIPLGLILNETISNALKHAFHDKSVGLIHVALKASSPTETIMIVKDNGMGTKQPLDELRQDSLGMDLIFSLTEQLDGDLTIETADGFAYEFKFPNLT